MEGLEATVLSVGKWCEDNIFSRLDSEYQIKMHLEAIDSLKRFGALQFKDDLPEIIHPQEIKREYVGEGGVWFLRAQNVRPLRIDPTNQVLISNSDAATLTRNKIEPDDVLITRTGANRGQCAIYDRDERAIASSHTFIVRPKTIDPQFLTVFLNSHFGKSQIDKGVYGAAQPEVAPYYLRNIWLPEVSSILISRIKSSFTASKSSKVQSETKHKEAEDTLLAALGLADWEPPEPLSYTARASDTFAAGRLDAEHFHPKFAAAFEYIHASDIEIMPLARLIEPIRNGVDLREFVDNGTAYIRVGDIKGGRIELDGAKRVSATKETVKRSISLQEGDVLFTRKGSFGNAAVAGRKGQDSIISTEIMLLRLHNSGRHKVNPDYLAAFFNTSLGKLQAEKWAHGVAFYSVTQNDLYKFKIPLVDRGVQEQIAEILGTANNLKDESKRILETAKRAVEIAIQNGEAPAMAFLDQAKAAN